MSWDAGAITGQIVLETGEFTGPIQRSISEATQAGAALGRLDAEAHHAESGMAEAGGSAGRMGNALEHAGHSAESFHGGLLHTLGVMEMFRVAAEVAFELPLELVRKAFDAAKEAASRFFEAIGEGGNVAEKMGLDAMKAGVDVSFFSNMSEAAKRVGVSTDELGMSFKFLQKNAADAASGMNQEAAKGFESIGISTEFLKSHLNDTQGLFLAVKERIGDLPSAAERTSAGLRIMGREASDLIPLFSQSNEQMKESMALGSRLGATLSKSAVEGAEGWVQSKAAFSDMWEGISRAIAEPVLDFMTKHWKEIRAAVISFTDAAVAAVPVAMKIVVGAMDPVVATISHVLENMAGLAELVGYLTGNSGLMNMGVHLQSLTHDLNGLRDGLDEVTHSSEKFAQQWQQHAVKADGRIDVGQGGPLALNTLNINVNGTDSADAAQLKRELVAVVKRHQEKQRQAIQTRNNRIAAGGIRAIRGSLFPN